MLMNSIPRLFTKHQTYTQRIEIILALVRQMKLSLYLDMRKHTAYDALWDDVIKQFVKGGGDHQVVLEASLTIGHLISCSVMAVSNNSKFAELEETLFSDLRESIGDQDISTMTIGDDLAVQIGSVVQRIALLTRRHHLSDAMDDDEGGQSSGWDIICSLAERGMLGYKEEARVSGYYPLLVPSQSSPQIAKCAMHAIFYHLAWVFQQFTSELSEDEAKVGDLVTKRDRARALFGELGLKDRSAVITGVRRVVSPGLSLRWTLADVFRRSRFISIFVFSAPLGQRQTRQPSRWRLLRLRMRHNTASPGPSLSCWTNTLPRTPRRRMVSSDVAALRRGLTAVDDMELELQQGAGGSPNILKLVSAFVAAIRCGVLEVDHASEVLSYYRTFGDLYDLIVRKLLDVLRDEGIYNKEGTIVQHVIGTALQNVSRDSILRDRAYLIQSHSTASSRRKPMTLRILWTLRSFLPAHLWFKARISPS